MGNFNDQMFRRERMKSFPTVHFNGSYTQLYSKRMLSRVVH